MGSTTNRMNKKAAGTTIRARHSDMLCPGPLSGSFTTGDNPSHR